MKYYNQVHPFHLVDPSPWPIVSATGAFAATFGGVIFFHSYQGGIFLLNLGLFIIVFDIVFWFRDQVRKGRFFYYKINNPFFYLSPLILGVFSVKESMEHCLFSWFSKTSCSGKVGGSEGKDGTLFSPYEKDLRFFDLNLENWLSGALSSCLLVFILLQIYILICFIKSCLLKEYIFSYVGLIKSVRLTFFEFCSLVILSLLFTVFISSFEIINNNLKVFQLLALENRHNTEMLEIDILSLKRMYQIDRGTDIDLIKPVCEVLGTCKKD